MRWLLIIIILFALAISVSTSAWAFDETHLKKFKALNKCEGCDLSGADLYGANLSGAILRGANLSGVDLSTVDLKDVKLDGAILCKTKMPWGEENSGCKKVETETPAAKQKRLKANREFMERLRRMKEK